MRSKKSKKINRGNIFGGMGSTETATFKLINMILLSVITAIVIYYTFGCRQSIPKGVNSAAHLPMPEAKSFPFANAVLLTEPVDGIPECHRAQIYRHKIIRHK